jgi:inosine-uridine nucleoside N-ribohydrolase
VVAAKNVMNYYKNITIVPIEIEEQMYQILDELQNILSKSTKFQALLEVYNLHKKQEEESRMNYSFLGFFSSIIVSNQDTITSKIKKPTDVDIIGRYTRGALIIEKYDYVKSGKFNEVNFIDAVDPAKIKQILNIFS